MLTDRVALQTSRLNLDGLGRTKTKKRKPLSSPDLSLLPLYLYYLILSLRLAHLPRMICHEQRKKMRISTKRIEIRTAEIAGEYSSLSRPRAK
eukprot:scaffold4432_cov108-Skeletonema_dohrnii-CCMP3373.AAC.2